MRTLSSLATATLALATVCPAQTLPLATGGTNTGNVGGGIYFNVTVNTTVTWNSLNYACKNDNVGPFMSSFNMFIGPSTWVGNVSTNPGSWILVATTTPVSITGGTGVQGSGPVQTVLGTLNPAGVNPGTVTFQPGNYGVALQAVNHQWSYSNGMFTFTDPVMTATTGGASNAFLTLPTFSPRSINGAINYTPGGTPMPFAQREPYGKGCYSLYRSFYEIMPNTATNQDLSNTSMYLTWDGVNGYSSIVAGTTPVDLVNGGLTPSLGHINDNNITINLEPIASPQPIIFPNIGGPGIAVSTVEMCSNMYVNLLGTAVAAPNPTVGDWLTGTSVRMGNHHNVDPSVGGTTHYDYYVAGATHLFTWIGVPDFNIAGTSNTFQLAFFANGDAEFRWGAMSLSGGGAWPTLVGFSPGTASLDPGGVDLSVRLAQLPPLSTQGTDRAPLTLTASTNPIQVASPNPPTVVNLTTSNVTGLSLGVCFIGVADLPGLSPAGLDLGFLGAPGCVANVNINPAGSPLIQNFAGPAGLTVPFTIPASPPSFIGQSFYCQSIWVDPLAQNQFFDPLNGLLTSNAVRLKLGAF